MKKRKVETKRYKYLKMSQDDNVPSDAQTEEEALRRIGTESIVQLFYALSLMFPETAAQFGLVIPKTEVRIRLEFMAMESLTQSSADLLRMLTFLSPTLPMSSTSSQKSPDKFDGKGDFNIKLPGFD